MLLPLACARYARGGLYNRYDCSGDGRAFSLVRTRGRIIDWRNSMVAHDRTDSEIKNEPGMAKDLPCP